MASTRITIRLSPVLAARLAAKVGTHGTLADTVRHAIELYLADESDTRQPRQPSVADGQPPRQPGAQIWQPPWQTSTGGWRLSSNG
jgi:hypothetical protein